MSSKLIDTDKAANLKQLQSLVPLAKVIVAASLVILLLLIVLSFTIGGNARFYAKWYQCNQKPVAGMPDSSHFRTLSHHRIEPAFALTRPSAFFCSPIQAEQHGYSADSQTYIFPNIKAKYGQVCRFENDPVSETAYDFVLCSEG